MKVGDVVQGASCRPGGGVIRGTVVLVKEYTLVVSTGNGNELVKKNGVEKVSQEITSQLINEFLQDRGYKKNTWTVYQKHLELVMKLIDGKINPSAIANTEKFINEKMPPAKAKQALGAIKKYLEWVGYYDVEDALPVEESIPVSTKPAPNRFNPSKSDKPDISQEERERKAKEMADMIKQAERTESSSVDEKVSLPRDTKQEETILDRDTATLVIIGKAFVKICSNEKEIHLTKDFKMASEVNELQAEVIIDEYGGRKVQVETKYILHYQ
ncbi:hypothetical protein [Enterococcus sp. SMC-9]|uniref:hypothetical protein n=1 Tax=Enterococcus sp. SMC-9 TaxID=2862343 RepID=UPI001E535A62|nr:hypothetical protein [Enterococcus sp. SMC-9]MCD1023490.1 hypothetical protein [Enterococcus sp. SMC-9]